MPSHGFSFISFGVLVIRKRYRVPGLCRHGWQPTIRRRLRKCREGAGFPRQHSRTPPVKYIINCCESVISCFGLVLKIKPENLSCKIKPLIDLELEWIGLGLVLCKVCLSLFWGKYGFTVLPATNYTCVIAPDRRGNLYPCWIGFQGRWGNAHGGGVVRNSQTSPYEKSWEIVSIYFEY